MKKTTYTPQIFIAFTPAQLAWLEEKRAAGWDQTTLVLQALDAFIAQWEDDDDDDDDEYSAVCGGGQGFCNLVTLPMSDDEEG